MEGPVERWACIHWPARYRLLSLVSSSLMGTQQMTAICMQRQSVSLPSVLGTTSDVPACNTGLVCKICQGLLDEVTCSLRFGLDWQSSKITGRQLYSLHGVQPLLW